MAYSLGPEKGAPWLQVQAWGSWLLESLGLFLSHPQPGQGGISLPAGPLSWPETWALSTHAWLSRASIGCWQANARLK